MGKRSKATEEERNREEFIPALRNLPERDIKVATDGVGFEQLRIRSGEYPIYTPPHYQGRRRPFAALGRFRDGTPCVHFRIFQRQAPGLYRISKHGCSFTLPELREFYLRLNDLLEECPELGLAAGRHT